jgi:hypothetical protein
VTEQQAFFQPAGDELVPRPEARGPWAENMMHGRLLAGVAAWALERDFGDPEMQFVRLTVDLFRNPPMEPVQVTTRSVRDGRRVRAADASVTIGSHEVARASALMLRRGEQPEGRVWSPPTWDAPHPDDVPPPTNGPSNPWFEMRPISGGGWGAFEQRRLWLRDHRPLVDGQPMSPFVKVATAADFANPWANSGDGGLAFINADITLYLSRDPVSDWIGFEVSGHISDAGVAIGHCNLYDTDGPLGTSTVAAVANQRMAPHG